NKITYDMNYRIHMKSQYMCGDVEKSHVETNFIFLLPIDAHPRLRHLLNMSYPSRAVVVVSLSLTCASALAGELKSPKYFEQNVRPLLKQYCYPCHSSEKHKGDFDMESFSSVSEVKRHPKVWQDVAEKLANSEMPPEEKPQPSPAEKERISNWVRAVLDEIARQRAGDPGPVVLRRLSNAEYAYTVQDLTV